MAGNKVKITVIKVFDPKDVFKTPPVKRSKPLPPCSIQKEGQVFFAEANMKPEGVCEGAWGALRGNVQTLLFGGNFPWMEEPGTEVVACPDGLRPVIYKLERVPA